MTNNYLAVYYNHLEHHQRTKSLRPEADAFYDAAHLMATNEHIAPKLARQRLRELLPSIDEIL